MKDISVKEIIATFKGVKRANILSSDETDDFLNIIERKNNWTFKEYKELWHEYSKEYLNFKVMDIMALHRINTKYKYKLSWKDYFKVIEDIDNPYIQTKYINHYLWYHASEMTEKIYKELLAKSYSKGITFKERCNFLQNYIKTDNSIKWINKYFTPQEIAYGLRRNSLYIDIKTKTINNHSTIEQEEKKVKMFYNQYEEFMDAKTKLNFFNQSILSGSINLIRFCYQEKKIKFTSKVKLLGIVCLKYGPENTLEILHCLKDIGVDFNQEDLVKTKNHNQWESRDHKEELLYFFKSLEIKKNYKKLDRKYKNKEIKVKLNKI